ncbi:MAG: thioredoxin family protein [Bacteroidota bacterium]
MKQTFLLQTILIIASFLIVIPKISSYNFTGISIYDTDYQKLERNTVIHWLNFEELENKLQTTPKPILIDAYTNWCGWCKRMDATTFKDEQVGKILTDSYYAVKLNAEGEANIRFDGKVFKEYELAKQLGVRGFPTVILINPETNQSKILTGYQKASPLSKQLVKFMK